MKIKLNFFQKRFYNIYNEVSNIFKEEIRFSSARFPMFVKDQFPKEILVKQFLKKGKQL
jgi:hypothetical protein